MNNANEKSESELLGEKYLLKNKEREEARQELIAVMKRNGANKILLEDGTWIRLSVQHQPDTITIRLPIEKETSE